MNSFLIYMKLQGLSEKTIAEHSRGPVKYNKIGMSIHVSPNVVCGQDAAYMSSYDDAYSIWIIV